MSIRYQYHHVRTEDGQESLTVFLPGRNLLVVTGDHPYFTDVLDGAHAGIDAEELVELADLSVAVARRFDKLSERVAVANGRLFFDGDEVDSSITRQILRCIDSGLGDYTPLVRFMENIAANPNDHSREQLFDWLNVRDFTITEAGLVVGYKGVKDDGRGGYESVNSGTAIRNGETVTGRIPNAVGDVIEMPRAQVQHNPSQGCSTGLHVATHAYAQSWSRNGVTLRVLVNPRDVVSVPTAAHGEKVRVCRYTVDEVIDAPDTDPLYGAFDMRWDESEDAPEASEDCGGGTGEDCPDNW